VAQGILVFHSVAEAVRAGYQIIDRTADGYLVRARVDGHWVLAMVKP
jgi:hypothetical protein